MAGTKPGHDENGIIFRIRALAPNYFKYKMFAKEALPGVLDMVSSLIPKTRGDGNVG
jgi:hypothetical protein